MPALRRKRTLGLARSRGATQKATRNHVTIFVVSRCRKRRAIAALLLLIIPQEIGELVVIFCDEIDIALVLDRRLGSL
jgi:hypothetical protein